ncbi:MAG: glutamate-1-semialdehyde 2,1-aminomutase [Candidatus Dormibacteria bacterium]
MPGGVSSPVRAFAAVGRDPVTIARGSGAHTWDTEGRRYLDFVASFGPLILGHAPPQVVAALGRQAALGTSFGAPTEAETELAQLLVDNVPSLEMVRFVSSGTEATMSALRLARAATGRDLVVKYAGGYHGHADAFLAEAGSGVATLGIPGSPGVPAVATALTVVLPYNAVDRVQDLFARIGGQIAAVFVEPVAGNMGVVAGEAPFLRALRDLTRAAGALLVYDEVISGFRLGPGGAQGLGDIQPDLTCLGKVIGGGLPLAAYGGRSELMRMMAPEGPVYQAGTLSGNPLATAAGIATLKQLIAAPPYEYLDRRAAQFQQRIEAAAGAAGVALTVNRVGSMFTPFFTEGPVRDFAGAGASDTVAYAGFFRHLFDRGVYPPPSQFEAWFISTEHGEPELAELEAALDGAFAHSL